MKPGIAFSVFVTVAFCVLGCAESWSGHVQPVQTRVEEWRSYCACWYWWWGCSYWRSYAYVYYTIRYQCSPGWTHNGNYDCNIPICLPRCSNGGTCVNPNTCLCPSTASGPTCTTLTCSYVRPCYPGDCIDDGSSISKCNCQAGFTSNYVNDGCIIFNSTQLAPVIGKSNVTLSNIRRTDKRVDYMFVMEGTSSIAKEIIWSNQQRFNNLRFEMESLFNQPDNLPERPPYVSNSILGVAGSQIEANVSKVARNGSIMRDFGSYKVYNCTSITRDSPATSLAQCVIDDEQFVTLIEHGDWLTVTFQATSGGFQKIINLDNQGTPYATKYYKGLSDIKAVEFRFDFIAPKHCSEVGASATCINGNTILAVDNEFTKGPIRAIWTGWTDDLSGVLEYYIEIFKLSPDPYQRLIEQNPLQPVFRNTTQHKSIVYPEYRPSQPGMYSVLLEVRDTANNSRTARRLVLYDNVSSITINDKLDGMLYISTAVPETGYKWQSKSTGQNVTITVNWTNHFINSIHEDNKLLNVIQPYPIQFKEIQDDGILYSLKFVNDSLDDHEGRRNLSAISNFHGIVQFEVAQVYTMDTSIPSTGWQLINPLAETFTFPVTLENGRHVRVWVRATDAMNNTKADNTIVRVDWTPPAISNNNSVYHRIALNFQNGTYNFTSRITLSTSDDESGIYRLVCRILVDYGKGAPIEEKYSTSFNASLGVPGDPTCKTIDGTCFLPTQVLDLDNCWFMVSQGELETAKATVEITAYNQAMLATRTTFEAGSIKMLNGLNSYDVPTKIRSEKLAPTGFRVTWDLPKQISCYGMASITLILLKMDAKGNVTVGTYETRGDSLYFDILGLSPETSYQLFFNIPSIKSSETSFFVKTLPEEKRKDSTGLIVGVAIGVLAIVAIVVVILVLLIRRGVITPAERVRVIRRELTKRFTRVYDNRQSELYLYGGMPDDQHCLNLKRSDITLEAMITSGHFANIYKAQLRSGRGSQLVVAKTLKEKFSQKDELVMRAKLNFNNFQQLDHPNILKFIGAVTDDASLGPCMVYEYCENGKLKEYLESKRNNVTDDVHENLFRFGLGISKGMTYLASKSIVHRRLAARNILLTFLNEVKISGFGPQPDDETDNDSGKGERIPIKWMAPECMTSTKDATEKSDVWSYAVVLWEIFTLGETPYKEIRAKELPQRLKKGERLSRPEICDDTWFAIMNRCWAYKSQDRPQFSVITKELDSFFQTSQDDGYYYYQRNSTEKQSF